MSLQVCEISKELCRLLITRYHYSSKCPGIKHCWGLCERSISGREQVVGCIVYSIPASYTLCNGVCGPEYRKQILELSRLVITTTIRNAASVLIGGSLRLLPDAVVVSYADCNERVGHVGYVYQATNWLYTGHANAEPMWVREDNGEIISYTRRHIDTKARELGYDWKEGASNGPGLVKVPQLGKHRYVIFTGTKKFRKAARKALRYKIHPYPKGDTRRHERNGQGIS